MKSEGYVGGFFGARACVILVLGTAIAIGVGYMVHNLYSSAETADFERDYDLLSSEIVKTAKISLSQINDICAHTAAIYSTEFPNHAQWPNVAHSRYGFMIGPLVKSLNVKNINHIPYVRPENLSSFEDFAYDFFANDPESIPNLGISDFGRGVFSIDSAGNRFHDTIGETTFSKYTFLAPVFQVADVETNSFVVMLNTHNEENRGIAIDATIDCYYSKSANGEDVGGCGSLTDVIYLLQDNVPQPASIFYYPEYLEPSYLVGFVGVVFNWDTIIKSTIPSVSQSSSSHKIVIYLDSPASRATFLAQGSDLTFAGEGTRLHSQIKADYKISGNLGTDRGLADSSAQFHIVIYPHEDMWKDYQTSTLLIVAVIVSCIIFACALLVFYLDFFITSKGYEAKITSSLRRMFLRYVSHELRSPLNAVYMGIVELLEREEFINLAQSSQSLSKPTLTGDEKGNEPHQQIEEVSVYHIAKDIKRDTEMAMVVLDDLVTYVDIVDDKPMVDISRVPVVCLRHIAIECVKSISHIFNEYNLNCKVRAFDSAVKYVPRFYTVKGEEGDLKLMFIYMLKVATKLCREGGDIELIFQYNETPQWRNSKSNHTGPTVLASIYFPDSSRVAADMMLLRSESNASIFEIDKLRAKSAWDFVSSDLGNWIVYHIATKYGGCVDIQVTKDENTKLGAVTISFEFPYFSEVSCEKCMNESAREWDASMSLNLISPEDASDNAIGAAVASMNPAVVEMGPNTEAINEANGDTVVASTKAMTSKLEAVVPRSARQSPQPEPVEALQKTFASSAGPSIPSTFHMPLKSVDTNDAGAKVSAGRHKVSISDHHQMKVLVVDDVPSNRKILSRLLTKKGHVCFLACDGQEVLKLIIEESLRIDAICMDYEMPIMDGPTAAKRLREEGCDIPIIGVTGNVLPADIAYFKKMGANQVIGKPVDIVSLEAAMQQLVKERRVKHLSESFDGSPSLFDDANIGEVPCTDL